VSEPSRTLGELLVQVLPKKPADASVLKAQVARKNLLTDVAGEEKRLADVPGDYETHNALGVAYAQLGRQADARAQFDAALALAPQHPGTHYNLGVIAMGVQRYADAIDHFQRTLASRPDHAEARTNLGVAFEAIGRPRDAEQQYREALSAHPNHAAAHNNLARTLLNQGDTGGAVTHFRAALKASPDNPDGLYNLGRALAADRKAAEAAQVFRRALAARPDSAPIMIDLAWVLANSESQNREAEKLAERANQLSGGNNPAALDVLAGVYASQQRFDLAVRTAQRAFQRALAVKNDVLAHAIRQRLEGYSQMIPDAEGSRIP